MIFLLTGGNLGISLGAFRGWFFFVSSGPLSRILQKVRVIK